jgi:hypothetical protein
LRVASYRRAAQFDFIVDLHHPISLVHLEQGSVQDLVLGCLFGRELLDNLASPRDQAPRVDKKAFWTQEPIVSHQFDEANVLFESTHSGVQAVDFWIKFSRALKFYPGFRVRPELKLVGRNSKSDFSPRV